MAIYNSAEAKAKFSALIAKAERGEEVIIARRGKPVARLLPKTDKKQVDRSGFIGCLKHNGWVAKDAFEPAPVECWFPQDDVLLK